jgi:hypothetical protein
LKKAHGQKPDKVGTVDSLFTLRQRLKMVRRMLHAGMRFSSEGSRLETPAYPLGHFDAAGAASLGDFHARLVARDVELQDRARQLHDREKEVLLRDKEMQELLKALADREAEHVTFKDEREDAVLTVASKRRQLAETSTHLQGEHEKRKAAFEQVRGGHWGAEEIGEGRGRESDLCVACSQMASKRDVGRERETERKTERKKEMYGVRRKKVTKCV